MKWCCDDCAYNKYNRVLIDIDRIFDDVYELGYRICWYNFIIKRTMYELGLTDGNI